VVACLSIGRLVGMCALSALARSPAYGPEPHPLGRRRAPSCLARTGSSPWRARSPQADLWPRRSPLGWTAAVQEGGHSV